MQNRQSSSALLQVLKVLNDDVAKSGAHANHKSIQRTRPPAAVSLQSMTRSMGSQSMSPSLGWRQLFVKLDAAQSQLLQAQTEMKISMQCTEPQQHAPGQLPSTWRRRLLFWYWQVFVCVC